MSNRICSEGECRSVVYARDVCRSHYDKARRAARRAAEGPRLPRLCTVDGCERKHGGRGYCQMHLRRLTKHGTTERVGHLKRRDDEFPADGPVKRCSKCRVVKTRSDFHRHKGTTTGLTHWCRQCHLDHYQANQVRNLAVARDRRMAQYGLTVERYEELLAEQGGVCAICKEPPPDSRRLAVDHDHSCCPGKTSCGDCVRALLCTYCNPLLGYAREDVNRLLAAVEYLNSFNGRIEAP